MLISRTCLHRYRKWSRCVHVLRESAISSDMTTGLTRSVPPAYGCRPGFWWRALPPRCGKPRQFKTQLKRKPFSWKKFSRSAWTSPAVTNRRLGFGELREVARGDRDDRQHRKRIARSNRNLPRQVYREDVRGTASRRGLHQHDLPGRTQGFRVVKCTQWKTGEPQEIRAFVLSGPKCAEVNLYWRPAG